MRASVWYRVQALRLFSHDQNGFLSIIQIIKQKVGDTFMYETGIDKYPLKHKYEQWCPLPNLNRPCMRACWKAIRQVNGDTSRQLANNSDSPHRVKREYMDWAKQSPQARGCCWGLGWGRTSFCGRLFKFQIPIRGSECHYRRTGVGRASLA